MTREELEFSICEYLDGMLGEDERIALGMDRRSDQQVEAEECRDVGSLREEQPQGQSIQPSERRHGHFSEAHASRRWASPPRGAWAPSRVESMVRIGPEGMSQNRKWVTPRTT